MILVLTPVERADETREVIGRIRLLHSEKASDLVQIEIGDCEAQAAQRKVYALESKRTCRFSKIFIIKRNGEKQKSSPPHVARIRLSHLQNGIEKALADSDNGLARRAARRLDAQWLRGSIDEERVRAWLQQFTTAGVGWIGEAVLQRIQMVQIAEFQGMLAGSVAGKTVLVDMGRLQKIGSGSFLAWLLRKSRAVRNVFDLAATLSAKPDTQVLWVEDCILTGHEFAGALDRHADGLRARQLSVDALFLFATQKGRDGAVAALREKNLEEKISINHKHLLDDRRAPGPEPWGPRSQEVEDYCRNLGAQLWRCYRERSGSGQ